MKDIGTRRWSRREWNDLEGAVPPNWLEVADASLTKPTSHGCRIQLSGYENGTGKKGNVLVEVHIQGGKLIVSTPDGVGDVEKLVQIGDAYWGQSWKKAKALALRI